MPTAGCLPGAMMLNPKGACEHAATKSGSPASWQGSWEDLAEAQPQPRVCHGAPGAVVRGWRRGDGVCHPWRQRVSGLGNFSVPRGGLALLGSAGSRPQGGCPPSLLKGREAFP